jgi:glycine/D-amino acid oxidase-like deaminating enzyme
VSNLFHPSLYRFDQAQPSYWEASAPDPNLQGRPLEGEQSCDVAIIGGGFTGLSAALHLARDYDVDVRVLEAGHIGWGASGRNGGFCSMGASKLSTNAQIRKFGFDQTRFFHRCSADAVELVRTLGQDEKIDFLPQGDGEYIVAESRTHYTGLCEEAEYLQNKLGVETGVLTPDEFREQGYDAPHQHGAIVIRPTFGLHPLRYCQGLAAAGERRGAQIHPHSRVTGWRKEGATHVLETDNGSLRAPRVLLTGNGFMPEHLHRGIAGRPLPLQSQIVVTRAMSDDELRERGYHTENPTINSRHMFFYYRRLSDGRFMLGGRGNPVGDPAGAEDTFAQMKRDIVRMWPAFADLEYEYQWRGLVCFGLNYRPSIGRIPEDPSVYFGYGYHGVGVSTASWSGRELAKWMAGPETSDELLPTHLPAIFRGRSPKFPLAVLRRQYLRAGLVFYRLRDWLDR